MLFPISTAVIALALVFSISRYGARGGLTIGLGAWALSIALSALPILDFNVEFSLKADLLVAVCTSALVIAYASVRARPTTVSTERSSRPETTATIISLGLGLTGCLFLLLDASLHGTSLNPGDLLRNLADIRSVTKNETLQLARGERPLFSLGVNLAAFAYVGVTAAIFVTPNPGRLIKSLAISCALGITTVSLFVFGGRTVLVNGALLAGVAFFLSSRKISVNRKTVAFVAVGLLATWFLAVGFFSAREGQTIDVDYHLHTLERAETPQYLRPAVNRSPAIGAALISYGYFASPLPALSWYVQQGEAPGPYWGSYSYPQATLISAKLGGPGSLTWGETRYEIFQVLESRGYSGNVWATWIRDLLVDFGFAGAALFCGLFGAFMAWTRNRYERSGDSPFVVLEAIATMTFAFGAFQNLLWVNVYQSTFTAALAFWLLVSLVRSTSRDVEITTAATHPTVGAEIPGRPRKLLIASVGFGIWLLLVAEVVSQMKF